MTDSWMGTIDGFKEEDTFFFFIKLWKIDNTGTLLRSDVMLFSGELGRRDTGFLSHMHAYMHTSVELSTDPYIKESHGQRQQPETHVQHYHVQYCR